MPRSKNRDIVANTPWLDAAWVISGGPKGSVTGWSADEAVIRRTLACLDGLVVPTVVEYVAQHVGSSEREPVTVSLSGRQLTEDDITSHLPDRMGDEGDIRLARLDIRDCRARLTLAGGATEVGIDSEKYASFDKSGSETGTPSQPPVRLTIFNGALGSRTDQYEVVLRSHTDIWFEETSIGSENRARLSALLGCLDRSLSDSRMEFESDYYSAAGLQRRGFEGLVPG